MENPIVQLVVFIILLVLIYSGLASIRDLIFNWIEEVKFKKALKRGDIKITFVVFEENDEDE